MSMTQQVCEYLRNHHGYHTASTIANVLNVKLSSVSSLLKKLVDKGVLRKIDNFGTRDGNGYSLNT